MSTLALVRQHLRHDLRKSANEFARAVRLGKVPGRWAEVEEPDGRRELCMVCRKVRGRRFRRIRVERDPLRPAVLFVCSSAEMCVVCAMHSLGGAARRAATTIARRVSEIGGYRYG